MPEPVARKINVADVAVNNRRGGELRVLLGPATTGATSGFLGVLDLAAGDVVSEHYHPYSEEFLYVVSGSVTVRVDGDRDIALGPGDGVMVPKNVRHRVTNPGTAPASCVFQLCPLAPRPDLGHVDTEEPPNVREAQPEVSAER
jgi:putative monooxygenase